MSRQVVAFQHFNLVIVHLAGTTAVCRCDCLCPQTRVQRHCPKCARARDAAMLVTLRYLFVVRTPCGALVNGSGDWLCCHYSLPPLEIFCTKRSQVHCCYNFLKARVPTDTRLSEFLVKRAAFHSPPYLFLKWMIWISPHLTKAVSRKTERVKYLTF